MNPLAQLILTTLYSVKTWAPLQWIGLVMVVAAYFLPRFVAMEASAGDALDTLYLVGGALLAGRPMATTTTATVTTVGPPPPTPTPGASP